MGVQPSPHPSREGGDCTISHTAVHPCTLLAQMGVGEGQKGGEGYTLPHSCAPLACVSGMPGGGGGLCRVLLRRKRGPPFIHKQGWGQWGSGWGEWRSCARSPVWLSGVKGPKGGGGGGGGYLCPPSYIPVCAQRQGGTNRHTEGGGKGVPLPSTRGTRGGMPTAVGATRQEGGQFVWPCPLCAPSFACCIAHKGGGRHGVQERGRGGRVCRFAPPSHVSRYTETHYLLVIFLCFWLF
jgi:hypothetical protein